MYFTHSLFIDEMYNYLFMLLHVEMRPIF